MNIHIVTGKGHGKTLLSAFDAALKDAGTYNYNLIYLSSIIPPGSVVNVSKMQEYTEQYGHRLYVVQAEARSRESGKYIGAALGWYQLPDGRGVFVEHAEIAETKKAVVENLTAEVSKSLSDLCRLRKFPLTDKHLKMKMSIVKVEDSPASTLVIAVYKAESWE